MVLETQIGGKYSGEDLRLFAFRDLVREAGIAVVYPAGEGVIGGPQSFALTHGDELGKPFSEIEARVLRSIKRTPIHVVFNIFEDIEGYIGESASIEVAWALVHNKPIILLRNPVFADSAPTEIQELVYEKLGQIEVVSLDSMSAKELGEYLTQRSAEVVDYGLTDQQKATCLRYVTKLLKAKRQDWQLMQKGLD